MTLSTLIAEFTRKERALFRSMKARSSASDRAALLRCCADTIDLIERYQPSDPQEARDQIYFFTSRAVTMRPDGVDDRALDIAIALCHRPEVPSNLEDRLGDPVLVEIDGGASVLSYVAHAPDRMALLDRDHRFLAVSDSYAGFHKTRPVRMSGAHLRDFVGEERFATRARVRLDACLAGRVQEYYHGEKTARGPRIMRVSMRPVRMGRGETAAVVHVRDVTDDVASIISAPES